VAVPVAAAKLRPVPRIERSEIRGGACQMTWRRQFQIAIKSKAPDFAALNPGYG
jgi:hypothetical protein